MEEKNMLIDLLLTAFIYLLFPAIYSIQGKHRTQKEIKKIAIVNGVSMFLFFIVLFEALEIEQIPNMTAAFIWSIIGYHIMKYRCCNNHAVPETNNILIQEYDIPESNTAPSNTKKDIKIQKFCKHCGSAIDTSTRKCTGCGKQYFKLSMFKKPFYLFVLLLSLFLNVFLVFQNSNLQKENDITDEYERIKTANGSLTIRNDLLEKENELLLEKIQEYNNKLSFFDDHAVIVVESLGNYYFTYEQFLEATSDMDKYSFWIYNTEQAINLGYKAYK